MSTTVPRRFSPGPFRIKIRDLALQSGGVMQRATTAAFAQILGLDWALSRLSSSSSHGHALRKNIRERVESTPPPAAGLLSQGQKEGG